MSEFIKNHKTAVSDCGIPDRLILDTDVKLWRFQGEVDVVFRDESFAWPEVVPVLSGDQEIGAATIYPMGERLVASVTATSDLPERLDFENGEMFELLAGKSYQSLTGRVVITSLKLVQSSGCSSPISTWESV